MNRPPMSSWILLALLGLQACAGAKTAPQTEAPPSTAVQEALPTFAPRLDPASGCVNQLDRQTARDLTLLRAAPRNSAPSISGVAILSFPETKKDLEAWNRMAIAAVRIYSAEPAALPIESVLIATEGEHPETYRVPPIFPFAPIKEIPADSPWRGSVGSAVQTLYVFVPLRLLVGKKAELAVRLRNRSAPFTLLKLPLSTTALPRGLKGIDFAKLREDERRMPDAKPILSALRRDFCLGG